MKKITIIIIFLLPLIVSAQCPDQWMQNVEASKNLLAKAEEFLKIDLRERPHQPGTTYTWRDSLESSYVSVEDMPDGKVRKIVIMGNKEEIYKLFFEQFLSNQESACIASRGSAFIKTKSVHATLSEGSYNRGQKRYTASITIIRL